MDVDVKMRALVGEWEGESLVFLGAADMDVYENCEDWEGRVERWRSSSDWTGITETREVDVTLSVPADLFSTPQLSAEVISDAQ